MPYVPDLFGKLCWEYYKHGEDAQLGLELDNGVLMDDLPVSLYVNPEEMRPLESSFLKKAKGRVLDLGCGPGRVAIYLRKQGFDVVGVDKSPNMVRLARAREIDVKKMDFNNSLPKDKELFDTVVMYGNGLGSPGTLENLAKLLNRLQHVTTNDAIIIGESNDPYRMQLDIDKEYQKHNLRLGRFIGQRKWRQTSGNIYSEWGNWVQTPPNELAKIASDNGWLLKKQTYEIGGPGTQWGAYFAILNRY